MSADSERENGLPDAATEAVTGGFADGPPSPHFSPLHISGNRTWEDLEQEKLSDELRRNLRWAPRGTGVGWGIPFRVDDVVLVRDEAVEVRWPPVQARWLVFMHTTDMAEAPRNEAGFIPATTGMGLLRGHVADYVLLYLDGTEERFPILRQYQIGMVTRPWGINCFEAVSCRKPHPLRTLTEQPVAGLDWGHSQFRVAQPDMLPWMNWLCAWENPQPDKELEGLRIEPGEGSLLLSAVTAGRTLSFPLRWDRRRKAVLRLPDGTSFDPSLSSEGLSRHVQVDLGQVISVRPRVLYPVESWEGTCTNEPPEESAREVLIEYAAHPEACFHLGNGACIPVAEVEQSHGELLVPVKPATRRVRLRVVDGSSGRPVAVKLHVHGEAGEYLSPVDRHRIPNALWYEDLSVDYVNAGSHFCSYIPGETTIDLPLGKVFVEISKGFEIEPIRRTVDVGESTEELEFRLNRVLHWRERGWVTADTHVHFLSPTTALLEGAGEGVNVVNLLASQWGELVTNAGDFDGRTTHGSRECGGDGEYLVRVGTENRQHVLGHISLLGYQGPIIAPMTTGGPDESALGDPVEILLTEWARKCRRQGGIVIVPHFPRPRAEHAVAIVGGDVDGVEMTSWTDLYGGIDPYSLSDWYRYLNCGYFVPAVGGTDKMTAATAVGAVRTYARILDGAPFDYDSWKAAVRSGETFVTYGPLIEFSAGGLPPGSRIRLGAGGGTIDVEWSVASVTVPMTRVELVVNGEIRFSSTVDARSARGAWSVPVTRSSWLALLVRGRFAGKPEMIAAHSSPVAAEVDGTEFFAAADAITILDQIEGSLAYFDTLATRAETEAYRRMRLILTSAHREVHNRLHSRGIMHGHTPATRHAGHESE